MATKPELKKQYKELVREGKTEEADKLLVSIQSFKSQIPEIEPVKKPEEKSKPAKDTKKSKEEFDSLLEIKGIGKETLKDIKKLYSNINELKKALKSDEVPLRNDVVKKLEKHLLKQ